MGKTSSAPPGSCALPAPSPPEGPARSCPPRPLPPRLCLPEATRRRRGAGAQRSRSPRAGVSRVRGPAPRSRSGLLLRPLPLRLPSRPHPGRCPAPTAARKDAAWVPCQASECAAPPSRARNAAGPRGRRRHPALRPASPVTQAARQVASARRGLGFFQKESRTAGLPACSAKPPKPVALVPSQLPSCLFPARTEIGDLEFYKYF